MIHLCQRRHTDACKQRRTSYSQERLYGEIGLRLQYDWVEIPKFKRLDQG